MEEQEVTQMPRIGDKAPDFKAMTTTGMMQFSEHIKGSWTILFFRILRILHRYAQPKCQVLPCSKMSSEK